MQPRRDSSTSFSVAKMKRLAGQRRCVHEATGSGRRESPSTLKSRNVSENREVAASAGSDWYTHECHLAIVLLAFSRT